MESATPNTHRKNYKMIINEKSPLSKAKSKKRFSRLEQYLHTPERKQSFSRRYKVTKQQRDTLEQTFTGRNLFSINLNFFVNTSNNRLARKKNIYINKHTSVGKITCTRCNRIFKNTEKFGSQCFCTMTLLQKWEFKQKLHKRNAEKLQGAVKAFRLRHALTQEKEQQHLKEQQRLQEELAWISQEKANKDKIWEEYLKTRPKMLAFLDNEHYFNLYGCKRE